MIIRWTFAFDEGHVITDVRDEAEDRRILERVHAADELLFIPAQGKEAYINLDLVKVIMREEIDETPCATEAVNPDAIENTGS